jgi:hypothetical protein
MAPQGVAHPIGSQALKTEAILTQSRKGRKEGQNPCVSRQVAKNAKKIAADDFFGLRPTYLFFHSPLRPSPYAAPWVWCSAPGASMRDLRGMRVGYQQGVILTGLIVERFPKTFPKLSKWCSRPCLYLWTAMGEKGLLG